MKNLYKVFRNSHKRATGKLLDGNPVDHTGNKIWPTWIDIMTRRLKVPTVRLISDGRPPDPPLTLCRCLAVFIIAKHKRPSLQNEWLKKKIKERKGVTIVGVVGSLSVGG